MKKLILSIFVVATLFSCSKSDITYEQEETAIGFAPIAKNITKNVAGYDYNPGTNDEPNSKFDTFDGIFPTEVDLYVFANAVEGTYSAQNVGSPYFQNAQFEWNSAKGTESTQGNSINTAGAYKGTPTRYWPNVKTLVFAGYSDACGVEKTTATMDFATNTLTIPSYTQNNATYTDEGTNDLMWFPCDGNAYSKQADEIAAQMKHACSWITINVAGDDVTENNWTLNSLVVKQLVHTGSVACNATSATWTIARDAAKNDEDYYNPATGTTFTTSFVKYEKAANNFIVIPQVPTSLDVTYTYTSQENNGTQSAITFTETKNVPLNYDASNSAWMSGYHYIYNVKITASEILIDPYVATWTEYDSDAQEDGNQPIGIPNI